MIIYTHINIVIIKGVAMKKRVKIIIGVSIAILLLIGLAIFIFKRDGSSDPTSSKSNVPAEGTEVNKTIGNTAVNENTASNNNTSSDEGIASNNTTTSHDDTDAKDKDNVSTDAATINASVLLKEVNSWQSGGSSYVQVDGSITNNDKTIIDNWEVTVPLASSAVINDSWNMNYELDNDLLSITSVEYNRSIPPNSSIAFGMIIMNSGDFDYSKARLTILGETVISDIHEDSVTPSKPDDTDAANDSKPAVPPTISDTAVVTTAPSKTTTKPVPDQASGDWLYTDGNKILDRDNKEVWITGLNWFGYNTGTNTFDGLWSCDLNTSISRIADRGFNLLRIPFSAELILQWKNGEYPRANYNEHVNSYLKGMNSLEIFDYVVGQCRANGIKIMIDIHSADTDAAGHMAPLWYTNKISEADYLSSLSWMADRYKNDDTIIAYDLKNEPHGAAGESNRAIWNDSKDSNNWKYIAEKAALAVLSNNPNALVVVEGIQIYPRNIKTNKNYSSMNEADYYNTWWGGNLRGVKDFPVDLGKYQNKLVYSPHDYGPTVYAQPWFGKSFTMDSLYKDCWRDNWMFIHEDEIAPILIGEWGGFMTSPNIEWMTYLRDFIIKHKLHHTFWCFNANSGDTGGLVLDDFTTWDEDKYAFVKKALWQKNGKFVGLDHEIPLGTNGISLNDY